MLIKDLRLQLSLFQKHSNLNYLVSKAVISLSDDSQVASCAGLLQGIRSQFQRHQLYPHLFATLLPRKMRGARCL